MKGSNHICPILAALATYQFRKTSKLRKTSGFGSFNSRRISQSSDANGGRRESKVVAASKAAV
jgi:hypothetical protein